jgi:hypothetical protein
MMFAAFMPGFLANSRFVVSDNAGATTANLLAHEPLFRLAFAGDLIGTAAYIAVAALFYELFKPVNRSISLLAACMSLVGCAVLALSSLIHLAPFAILGSHYSSAFNGEQVRALAMMFLKLGDQCFTISFVFFGFYCLLIGYLVYRSTFLPRPLGAGMALAGMAWLTFLLPPLAHSLSPYVLVGGLGEAALTVWLLFAGVDVKRWTERAELQRLA